MKHYPFICEIGSAMALYFIATLLYSGELYSRRRFHGLFATILASAGYLSNTVALITWLRANGGFPSLFTEPLGGFLLLGWVIIGAYLLVECTTRLKALGAIALPVGLFTMLIGTVFHPHQIDAGVSEALRSHVTVLHVLSILVGYASFAVAFCAAISYLVGHRMLKAKRFGGMFDRLPALNRSDELALRMVLLGFPLLTLGLGLGIFRAEVASGHLWLQDVKVIASLLVWLIYAAYLISRKVLGWTGRKPNYLLIAGFILIVIAYTGGLAMGPGMHGLRFLGMGGNS